MVGGAGSAPRPGARVHSVTLVNLTAWEVLLNVLLVLFLSRGPTAKVLICLTAQYNLSSSFLILFYASIVSRYH